ncbi:D-alanyl-D-alanine carboxypeptidase/D-alanyl-D-alanine-endopeptidase [Ectothiorhodospira magna]|nr:D-alanyl-D-alanine carboxypeptidase/D-alanyl-D-alanine-endopeptidase [Ectothiorhodospira magna]
MLLARILIALCLVMVTTVSAVAQPLPPQVQQLLTQYRIPPEGISVLVQPVTGGTPLLAHGADVPRNPASAIKLVTTFAALDILGPAHTWRTELYTVAPVIDGTLRGDLYIRGGGDPFLVAEQVWKMTGALRRSGIQRIQGDLVFDLTRFDIPREDPGAFDGQPFRAYNQPPHALLMNFNAISFQFRSAEDGRSVQVYLDPPLADLRLENRLRLGDRACNTFPQGVGFHVAGEQPAPRVLLDGEFPRGCQNVSLLRTALPPEDYAYSLFKTLWGQWGGTLDGHWRLGRVPEGAGRPRVVHQSPPLGDLIRPVNKHSNNVMTRHMKLALGAQMYGEPATLDKGYAAIRAVLERQGIATQGLILDNAAGLSRTNRITAQQLASVLLVARQRPFMPEYASSLALSGMDGTLRRRFVGQPEAGRMHLKTGYINHVSSVAGYVRTAGDRDLVVVVLINHPNAHRWAGLEIQDAVLRWAYRQG